MGARLFWSKDRESQYQRQNDKAEERAPLHVKRMEVLAASFLFSESLRQRRRNIQFNLPRKINILKVKR